MNNLQVTSEERQKFNDLISSLIKTEDNKEQIELVKSSLEDLKKIYILFMIEYNNALIFLDILDADVNDTPTQLYEKAKEYYDNVNENIKLAIAISCINQLFSQMETFMENTMNEFNKEENNNGKIS